MLGLRLVDIGIVSGVGMGAEAACAAIRAGISAARGLDYFSVLDVDAQEPTPVIGHPVRGYTDGFAALGRLIRLCQGAVADLLRKQSLRQQGLGREGGEVAAEAAFWHQTGLIVIVPRFDKARFLEAEEDPVELREAFLGQLRRVLALGIPKARARLLEDDATGAATALHLARERINNGSVARCLIIAADSYLDRLSLEWLADNERLKSPSNPVGLAPGEMGVCLLVEASERAPGGRSASHAIVDSVAAAFAPEGAPWNEVEQGRALARVVESALGRSPGSASHGARTAPFEGDIVLDLNGEARRAAEWGHASTLLTGVLGRSKLMLPAMSVGDVGAARSLLGVAVAARSFVRRYASADRSLVLASAACRSVAAVLVCREAA